MDQPKKKKVDPFKGLKFLGYRLSQLPDKYKTQDLIRYAKFFLAEKTGTLLKDPIWDEYTAEELLAEFYAHQFVLNKGFKMAFEQEIGDVDGKVDDFAAWADKQMAKDKQVRDRLMGETEDKVSFDPSMVMGDD